MKKHLFIRLIPHRSFKKTFPIIESAKNIPPPDKTIKSDSRNFHEETFENTAQQITFKT